MRNSHSHKHHMLASHTSLPLALVLGAVWAPQNAPFFWPPQPDAVTPGALQEWRDITVPSLTPCIEKFIMSPALSHSYTHTQIHTQICLCQDRDSRAKCSIPQICHTYFEVTNEEELAKLCECDWWLHVTAHNTGSCTKHSSLLQPLCIFSPFKRKMNRADRRRIVKSQQGRVGYTPSRANFEMYTQQDRDTHTSSAI